MLEPMNADHEPWLVEVVRELRRPVAFDADFDRRVMHAVRAASREGLTRRLTGWWTRPRTLRLSPLGALALAAGVVLLLFGAARLSRPQAERLAAAPATVPGQQVVQFVLVAPEAHEVSLVGDFNDWSPGRTPLQVSAAGGVWTVQVPVSPGRHEYAFVVDGHDWRPDPAAPRSVNDDFGTPNSVITVRARS